MMMFEKRLKPTAELIGKAQEARRCESKLPDLYARRNQQAAVTKELSTKLAELFEARAWESAPSPEEARAAKREVAELSDRLEEEREFFQAISIAIQGVQNASSSAIDALNEKIDGIVRAVAADAEEGILATLDSAVKDTMALYAMRHGVTTDVEPLVCSIIRDQRVSAEVMQRVNSAQRALREGVDRMVI